MRAVALALLSLAAAPHHLHAQAPVQQQLVRGRVYAADGKQPLVGALVRALGSRAATTTDRAGRFTLWLRQMPDTIVAAAIGHHPDTLLLTRAPSGELQVPLRAAAVALAEVIVTAPGESDRELSSIGRWQLPIEAVRSVPPAVEADVFRALTLVPAVSFSTPLSARPLVRGYDAGESSVRIDGFEILNLYHIGRAFSAFPADATEQVGLTAAPHASTVSGTLSGVIDITGQSGTPHDTRGGANLSLGAASGWLGGGSGMRWFSGVRAVHFAVIGAATNKRIPYDFQDVYASGIIDGANGPAARITVFGSRDNLADRDAGSGMDWSNLLVGGRWYIGLGEGWLGEAWASGNRFAEDVRDVPARRSFLDVRNRFSRLGTGVDLTHTGASARVQLGGSVAWRNIGNRIAPLLGAEFPSVDDAFDRLELSGYVDGSRQLGRVGVQLGARVDAAGSVAVVQPRARVRLPLAASLALGVAAGRTTRLFHLVSDPRAEPDLAFYDFWMNAGQGDVPTAIADHVALDLDWTHGALTGRTSVFGSRARGLMELRPEEDQDVTTVTPFRSGRGRTRGFEAQVGVRGGGARPRSLSVTYVLSRSERQWEQGWVPWVQDRRHLVRLLGNVQLGTRWTLFGAFEAASGPPLTPVDQVIFSGAPDPNAPGSADDPGKPAYIFGPENSARSPGTARADLGLNYTFRGPGKSRMALGFSVINVGFGPVAPLVPDDPYRIVASINEASPAGRVTYKRLFDLPAIPTATLRIEF